MYPKKIDEIIDAMGTNNYIWYWFEPTQESIYITETIEIFPTNETIKSNIVYMSYGYKDRKLNVKYNNSHVAIPYKSSKVFNILKSINAFERLDV